MKLTPIELNIRASWAINCAVAANGDIPDDDDAAIGVWWLCVENDAKEFVKLLYKVKAYIEPPLLPDVGKSKAEKKEGTLLSAELDAGNIND